MTQIFKLEGSTVTERGYNSYDLGYIYRYFKINYLNKQFYELLINMFPDYDDINLSYIEYEKNKRKG